MKSAFQRLDYINASPGNYCRWCGMMVTITHPHRSQDDCIAELRGVIARLTVRGAMEIGDNEDLVYKVVRVSRDRNNPRKCMYWSACVTGGIIPARYRVGHKTPPPVPGSKLFVFPSKPDAVRYLDNITAHYEGRIEFRLMKGRAENMTPCSHKVIADFPVPLEWARDTVYSFWAAVRHKQEWDNGLTLSSPPEGSYLCDSFTPQSVIRS